MLEKLNELVKKYEALGIEIQQLQEQMNEPQKLTIRELQLDVNGDGFLELSYDDRRIGCIDTDGRCMILNRAPEIEVYEAWRDDGCRIDETPVEWRGRNYAINASGYLECVDISCGCIYELHSCTYATGCTDTNIQRHKHNDCPIGF